VGTWWAPRVDLHAKNVETEEAAGRIFCTKNIEERLGGYGRTDHNVTKVQIGGHQMPTK